MCQMAFCCYSEAATAFVCWLYLFADVFQLFPILARYKFMGRVRFQAFELSPRWTLMPFLAHDFISNDFFIHRDTMEQNNFLERLYAFQNLFYAMYFRRLRWAAIKCIVLTYRGKTILGLRLREVSDSCGIHAIFLLHCRI